MKTSAQTALLTVVLALAAFVALLSWGLASPVGSAPDDDFHLASMWCPPPIEESGCRLSYGERGQVVGVYVPELVARPNCYAFYPRISATCQDRLSTSRLVSTVRVDQGEYPGPYYRFAHLFVGPDIAASVLALRAFNAALAVVLVGAAALLTQWRLRSGIAWAIAASIVPLAMFLVPSTNPSSWAFTGLTAFWISCFALARATTTRHRVAAAAVALTGAAVALVARNDSFLYVILALAATAVLYAPLPGRRGRRGGFDSRGVLLWLVVAGASLGLGLWSFLTARSSTGILPDENRATRDPWSVFASNLLESLQVPAGLLGFAQLGWNDVRPPAVVYVTSIAITSFVLLTGMRELSPRKLLALIGVGGTFVLLPIVMLQRALAYVGDQVQPRYFMSVLPLLIGVALLSGDGQRALRFGRIQSIFAWGGLTMANSVILLLNIRRYAVGTAGTYFPGPDYGWWWPAGPTPLGLWGIGTVAFALAALVLVLASGGTGYRRDLVGTVVAHTRAQGAAGGRTGGAPAASEI